MTNISNVNEILDKIPQFPYMKNDDYACPICMDTINVGTNIRMLPCSHVFCPGCIRSALETNPICPICRASPMEKIKEIEEYLQTCDTTTQPSNNNSRQSQVQFSPTRTPPASPPPPARPPPPNMNNVNRNRNRNRNTTRSRNNANRNNVNRNTRNRNNANRNNANRNRTHSGNSGQNVSRRSQNTITTPFASTSRNNNCSLVNFNANGITKVREGNKYEIRDGITKKPWTYSINLSLECQQKMDYFIQRRKQLFLRNELDDDKVKRCYNKYLHSSPEILVDNLINSVY